MNFKPEVLIIYGVVAVVIVALVIGYTILRKRLKKKMDDQKALVDENKINASIFVIEKRKAKITEANLPKNVMSQIPALYKIRKMPLITAKIGQQIVTLVCEDDLYDKIPDKKNINVELAGIFIVSVKNNPQKPGKKKKRK
jgi:uncharacterized membrane protein YqiK